MRLADFDFGAIWATFAEEASLEGMLGCLGLVWPEGDARGPKMAQVDLKMAQCGPKMARGGPKMAQDVHDGVKMENLEPSIAWGFALFAHGDK